MIGLQDQADAIKTQLETISSIGTVIYLDEENQTRRHPATLPAAYLALAGTRFDLDGNAKSNNDTTWSVLLKTRKMTGSTGSLALIDDIFDSLNGFRPMTGTKKLRAVNAEYINDENQGVNYILTFTTIKALVS